MKSFLKTEFGQVGQLNESKLVGMDLVGSGKDFNWLESG